MCIHSTYEVEECICIAAEAGKEFDNVGDVLSLYDKQQLGKLAGGGVMSEAVPEGGS
jgi:hypothetical protein